MKGLGIMLLLLVMVLLSGCGSKSIICEIPEAEGSMICDAADKLNTTPEARSQTLLITNLGVLDADIYTAQEADKFVDTIVTDLKKIHRSGKKISYMQVVDYMNEKFNLLSPKAQAAFVIIDTGNLASQEIELPLTDYDIDLLLKHLKKQKAVIAAYL